MRVGSVLCWLKSGYSTSSLTQSSGELCIALWVPWVRRLWRKPIINLNFFLFFFSVFSSSSSVLSPRCEDSRTDSRNSLSASRRNLTAPHPLLKGKAVLVVFMMVAFSAGVAFVWDCKLPAHRLWDVVKPSENLSSITWEKWNAQGASTTLLPFPFANPGGFPS